MSKSRWSLSPIKLLAVLILLVLYGLTIPPRLGSNERKVLKEQFSFNRFPLFEPKGQPAKAVRQVHPQYEPISAWISSVGAAVAFADIDQDGKFNDLIHIDPRYDQVWIEPAEGPDGVGRYVPFPLLPDPLTFDPATMAPMGVLPNDFDEDGQMDVLVYYWGRTPIIFYQDAGHFVPQELTDAAHRWFSNAGTLADFDGDGHIDILVTNYFPEDARVLDASATDLDQTMQHSMSRAFNGGKNYLYLWKRGLNGEVAFELAKGWNNGIANPNDWTLAVGAADLNGDLLPEIYFANDFGPDKLMLNLSTPGQPKFKLLKGARDFTGIPSSTLGKDSFKGMGVDFGDINQDGHLDIYVSNIADEYALEESHFAFLSTDNWQVAMTQGRAPFRNESEQLGLSRSSWGWDSKLADFNNDGQVEAIQATGFVKGQTNRWPELQELAIGNDELLANPEVWPNFRPGADLSGHEHNPFFVRSRSGRFYDLAAEIGLGDQMVTRGIAISDMDLDGDLDFAFANQWEPSFLYSNEQSGFNAFLGINLLLPLEVADLDKREPEVDPQQIVNYRYAIGAVAKLSLPDGSKKLDFVDGGNGHSGVNSQQIFFGLGAVSTTDMEFPVEIHWIDPQGKKQVFTTSLSPGWHTILLYSAENSPR